MGTFKRPVRSFNELQSRKYTIFSFSLHRGDLLRKLFILSQRKEDTEKLRIDMIQANICLINGLLSDFRGYALYKCLCVYLR